MPLPSPLDLRVPRNLTATLQLIQRLVGREDHQRYCSGVIPKDRLPQFLQKMADRYPQILRTTRERSYDRRRRGHAAMHMIVFPSAGITPFESILPLHWLLLSNRGKGGLADVDSADFEVSKDAMAAISHIVIGDYVLLYATKRRPHRLPDRSSGRGRVIFTDTSTWTWKLRGDVMKELRAQIQECCRTLDFGANALANIPGNGLRGLLASQCERPLFAGVRNQIIDLYRYAADTWPPYRNAWLSAHPGTASNDGSTAGMLPPVNTFMKCNLPMIPQIRLYGTPARTVRDLLTATT